jgi:4-hydroxy-3-polyprenylbenzoate decarboxylase
MKPSNVPESDIVLGLTGASGQIYGKKLLELFTKRLHRRVHLLVSKSAEEVIISELKCNSVDDALDISSDNIICHDVENFCDELASGSTRTAGMIICPCSTNTLGCLASGTSDNLIKRAALVHIKEHRRLILCVREMPISLIDIENMQRLSRAGAIICPLSPSFYHHPKTMDELLDFTVERIAGLLTDFDHTYCYKPD